MPFIILMRSEEGTDFYDGFGYSPCRRDAKVIENEDQAHAIKAALLKAAQENDLLCSIVIRELK